MKGACASLGVGFGLTRRKILEEPQPAPPVAEELCAEEPRPLACVSQGIPIIMPLEIH